MADVILMPRLSDTMTEGVIASWHKKVGDAVKKGDLLAEVETDKATMELESYKDGTLLHLGGDKGTKLQVNDLLAIIGKPGEDISSLVKSGGAAEKKPAEPAKTETKKADANAPASETKPAATSTPAVDISKLEEVILMPRLSDTMTEGVIADWHKKVGDTVKKGDILADIETDKATMELESYKTGKLLFVGAQKGEKIQVNDLLAIIGDEKKVDVQKIVNAIKNKGAAPTAAASQAESQPAAATAAPAEEHAPSLNGDGRVKASPLAKKLAAEKGIDIAKISGSGDGGRIVKADIDNYKPAEAKVSDVRQLTSVAAQQPSQGVVSFDEVPVSQMRKVIAKRLAESKFTAPHFYLTMSIDMDKAVESRAKLNEVASAKISFNDIVLKAVAVALKQHPNVNSSWLGDKIRINHHVNIGVAVAVEDGLLVPVVRFADTKSLTQIATEVKDFAQRAKNKKLQPADWEGSTFTISNLGMFGIDEFTAIINPPGAAILALGATIKTPVVADDDSIVIKRIMKVTLSCDHRVIDGAVGAAFLTDFKKMVEDPYTVLL